MNFCTLKTLFKFEKWVFACKNGDFSLLPARVLCQITVQRDGRLRYRVVILASVFVPNTVRVVVVPCQVAGIASRQRLAVCAACFNRNLRARSGKTGLRFAYVEDHLRRALAVDVHQHVQSLYVDY